MPSIFILEDWTFIRREWLDIYPPHLGKSLNIITFIGPAFERYFIRTVRDIVQDIKTESLRHTAELFCQQEGQYAKQHIAHLKMLDGRYPGLAAVQQAVFDSYDRLYSEHSTEFNLSYMASLELLFTPFALYCIKNLDILFGRSDPRIASFMLWHLVEEFEHRTAAYEIYQELVGNHRYRLRNLTAMARHLKEVGDISLAGIHTHIPTDDNPTGHTNFHGLFKNTTGKLSFMLSLLNTLLIRSLDRGVGQVMEALKANGLDENTLVIFTSDNGGAGYIGLPNVNAPYRGWKSTLFEGGIRVPFLAPWPSPVPGGGGP